ncbi:MAG: hypothetical protein QOE61_5314 [Micromonosporaceae bacterium]|nr:hypothetical protein [Micromonosporaceae bacterium]
MAVAARLKLAGLKLAGPKLAGLKVATTAVVVTVVVTLAACGSGTKPEAWAGQVCDALTPWRAQIAQLNARAQQQMSSAGTPAETRASLLELLAGGQTASETARAAVVAAGAPDVDGGAEVAGRFAASLEKTRDAYAHARAAVAALSTNDASTFYDGVVSVMTTLNAEYARSGVDTSKLDSVELRNAFDKTDRCR